MGIDLSLEDIQHLLESLGIYLSKRQTAILVVVLISTSLGAVQYLFKAVAWVLKTMRRLLARRRRGREEVDFIRVRNRFARNRIIEIERINQESDWNDFYYTELEAEVEVEYEVDLDKLQGKLLLVWLRSIPLLFKQMFHRSSSKTSADSLVDAISWSSSRAFLIIGDPGSGKTVSLRHLCMRMATECATSHDEEAVVPLYLNLKGLNTPSEEISAETIREWVLEQLRTGQDRLIDEFLKKHFSSMLDKGLLFFLFDSFDEIPAIMDAQEDAEPVKTYALALSRFLHGLHGCRGLVASRPYRAPKVFVGQRMTIKPLSIKRIQSALAKYLANDSQLAKRVWQNLIRDRDDLLYVASNPFYLNLIARYIADIRRLPIRQYDLFEHFVQSRVSADEKRLHSFGLDPSRVVHKTSILAYNMSRDLKTGLEATVEQLVTILGDADREWSKPEVERLLKALTYSKLARSQEQGGQSVFSFVHRRFHEYLSARYLSSHPDIAPFKGLMADNRWREILVLLCEVLPANELDKIVDVAHASLSAGIQAASGTKAHREAIETLRFLRDGFRSRLEDLPSDTRKLCASFIEKQFETGHDLDQKRSVESIVVADQSSQAPLLEKALSGESDWVRGIAIRSCRSLKTPTREIARKFREYLFRKYWNLTLYRDFRFYSITLSSPSSFLPIQSYLKCLGIAALVQVLFLACISFSA